VPRQRRLAVLERILEAVSLGARASSPAYLSLKLVPSTAHAIVISAEAYVRPMQVERPRAGEDALAPRKNTADEDARAPRGCLTANPEAAPASRSRPEAGQGS
jgi:hypothetical protein